MVKTNDYLKYVKNYIISQMREKKLFGNDENSFSYNDDYLDELAVTYGKVNPFDQTIEINNSNSLFNDFLKNLTPTPNQQINSNSISNIISTPQTTTIAASKL